MSWCRIIPFLVLFADLCLNSLFSYIDLYFNSLRKESQIIFHGVSKDIPLGVPVDEMNLVSITITIYDPEDCKVKNQ